MFLGVFLLLFFGWQGTQEFTYFYREQQQIFLFDRDFIFDRLTSIGGFASLAAQWLVQFFVLPKVGAMVTALLCVLGMAFLILTLKKLNPAQPEVKAMQDFSNHIQTLSALENIDGGTLELEDTPILPFCEELVAQVRDQLKTGVNLKADAPKINAPIYKPYVSHILRHLLRNAAIYTPEGGSIWLDFKKRGPHTYQFLVSDTGCGIPEEKQEDVFKPFLEIHDLTMGDGLGLPICRQMAVNMKGDLTIDPSFTKGTRFILELHA